MSRYAMRIDAAWRPLLGLFGGRNSASYVEVSDDTVYFQFGPWFKRTVPRDLIDSFDRMHWPWWRGIGWRSDMRGLVGLIGSTMGVVEVRLKQRIDSWGPFPCDRIAVSLDDPVSFLEELASEKKRPRRRQPSRSRKPASTKRSTTVKGRSTTTRRTRSGG